MTAALPLHPAPGMGPPGPVNTRAPFPKFLPGASVPTAPFPSLNSCANALYHPAHGYYSRKSARRFGDYYTSVDVHPIFGRLLARQFAEMWRVLGSPRRFFVVESAAGVGRLAGHILDFSANAFPSFYAALDYVAVERSSARRAEHGDRLAAHAAAGHVSSAGEIPSVIPAGCIFSNELLDALPVHRVLLERVR